MRSFQVPRWIEWVAGLHPPPVNWDVWKPGQHRHGVERLAGDSVHVTTFDPLLVCRVAPSLRVFSIASCFDSSVIRVPFLLACVGVAVSV